MALPLWGQLQKSQDDAETIEEAIDRIVAEHNGDSEAHLGEGQSIAQHKAEDIIDHPALSIIADKYAQNSITSDKLIDTRFIVRSSFESLDGFKTYRTGSRGSFVLNSVGDLSINVGGTANDYAALYFENEFLGANIVPYLPFFEVVAYIQESASSDFIMFVGNTYTRGSEGGFGFIWKASTEKLYAWWKDGSTLYEEELTGFNVAYAHRFRAELFADKIEFKVDNVLLYTATANLPEYTEEFRVGFAFKAIDTSSPQNRAASILFVMNMPV